MTCFRTVLLVDASLSFRDILRCALSHPGAGPYRITEAATGAEALAVCAEDLPDGIVLSDLLPDADGIEILQALQNQWPAQPLPVVLLTAQTSLDRVIQGIMAGAQEVVTISDLDQTVLPEVLQVALTRVQQVRQWQKCPIAQSCTKQALLASEAKNKAMLQVLPDLIMRMTVEGQYLDFFSGGALKNIHLPHPEVSHNTAFDIFPEDLAQQRIHYLRQAIATQELQIYEQELWIEGEKHWEEVRIVPCGEEECLVVVRDTTERKLAEEALRQSEAQNRAMLQALPDLIMRMTVEGQYLDFFSGGAVKPITLPQPIIHENYIANTLPLTMAQERMHYIQLALEQQTLQFYEQTIQIQGEIRYEEVRIVPCGDREVLVVVRDITERKQAEAALQTLNEELEKRVNERTEALMVANRSLRQSELTNQALIKAIPDLLIRMNREGIYLDISKTDNIRLMKPEQLRRGTCIYDILPQTVADERMHCIHQVLQTQQPTSHEYELIIEGERIYEEARITPCEMDTVLVMVRDISARKRAEAKLLQNDARFSRIAANAPGAMYQFVLYPDGRQAFPYMSDRILEILGITAEVAQAEGDRVFELVHPADQASLQQSIQESASQLCRWTWEGRAIKPSGELVWIQGMSQPEPQADGSIIWDGLILDITERKQAEQTLQRTNSLLRAQQEASIDGILIIDENHSVSWYNRRFAEIWEIPAEIAVLPNDRCLLSILLTKVADAATFLHKVPQLNQSSTLESADELHLKDGRILDCYSKPLISDKGDYFGRIWFFRDITERKRSEEEIHRAWRREKELNDLKSRFIAMTSHEFRTPLSVIASSAGILKLFGDRLNEQKKQEHLKIIQTYVKHTTDLLDDILLLNRAEVGKLAFDPTPLNLIEFCQALTQELQLSTEIHHLWFTAHQRSPVPQPQAPMPPSDEVWMDKKLLRQILTNLLTNAIKYSPQSGEIAFSLVLEAQTVCFSVQDWGLGIPAEDQAHLFESFHRAANVGNIQGTGLGLSVVQRCVELHGGTITVHSQVGEGSTFVVQLPRYCKANQVAPFK